ncbi:MAG: mechanosensitive ion channel family protein [Bryobacterales bacterium]|nr:mechanosensitive ion channel family protein [Bryobacterales bacterium]
MNEEITFKSLFPEFLTMATAICLFWSTSWLFTRAIRRSARQGETEPSPGMEHWAGEITRFARRTAFLLCLVAAVLTMLYGVGITGVPRLTWKEIASWLHSTGIPVLFIAGSALILLRALQLLVARLPGFLIPTNLSVPERAERAKRVETRGRLFRWTSSAAVLSVAALMILRRLDVDVTPILTGGAIVSVALGLGAQNYVRDIIGGLFFILEDQVRVGDVVNINGKGGQVESIQLRTTTIRGEDGTVHIFPNGNISAISNMTKNFSYYVIELGIAYEENVDRVMALIMEIGAELRKDPKFSEKILAPLEMMGVNAFADSAVIIKFRIKTVPLEQWGVGRELRRRIKNTFDAQGIELPYPHISVYAGEATKPFPVRQNRDAQGGR